MCMKTKEVTGVALTFRLAFGDFTIKTERSQSGLETQRLSKMYKKQNGLCRNGKNLTEVYIIEINILKRFRNGRGEKRNPPKWTNEA